MLGLDAEQDIRDWIIGMQRNGTPVGRLHVNLMAKEVYAAMYDRTRSAGTIDRGWY